VRLHHVAIDGLTSLAAAWAISTLLLAVGMSEHANEWAFYLAWISAFVVAVLARREVNRGAATPRP
jgi:hypothetical protein